MVRKMYHDKEGPFKKHFLFHLFGWCCVFLARRSLRGRLVEVFGTNPPPESLIHDHTAKSHIDLGEKQIKVLFGCLCFFNTHHIECCGTCIE
jgi:hypothetical protein